MSEIFLVSALVQAAWGTLLGWPLVSLTGGQSSWGPFKNPRRLLQAHLDNLFMAALQLGVAASALEAPSWVVWFLVAGSWINPQLFLLQAMRPELTLKQASSRWASAPSFLALTIAYFALAWLAIKQLLA